MSTAIIISADIEWRILRTFFPDVEQHSSPMGAWFETEMRVSEQQERILFFHGGWGKVATAASTQYVIDHWLPNLLINIGTCGGFEGAIERGTIILVERTIIYDIIEMMTGADEAIAAYATTLDLTWLAKNYPHPVQRGLLVSADRDLQIDDIPMLKTKYGAVAGDWESGAIAYIASRNNVRCLILRGVSDLVGSHGEAYGNIEIFVEGTRTIFSLLLEHLPAWIELGNTVE